MSNYDCDAQYKDIVKRILTEGEERQDRTGTGALSVFGGQMKFDLRERFPLVQCKETRYKVAFLEMLFFLRGEGNTKYLNDNGCKLWECLGRRKRKPWPCVWTTMAFMEIVV